MRSLLVRAPAQLESAFSVQTCQFLLLPHSKTHVVLDRPVGEERRRALTALGFGDRRNPSTVIPRRRSWRRPGDPVTTGDRNRRTRLVGPTQSLTRAYSDDLESPLIRHPEVLAPLGASLEGRRPRLRRLRPCVGASADHPPISGLLEIGSKVSKSAKADLLGPRKSAAASRMTEIWVDLIGTCARLVDPSSDRNDRFSIKGNCHADPP
jgi:hypothetical protein